MSNRFQNIIVMAFFIAVVAFIAYPVLTSNSADIIAKPADQMHLKIDQSDKNDDKNTANDQEDKIINPIFTEN